jgi:hypothetical protein
LKVKLIHNRAFFLTTHEEILTSKTKIKDADNQMNKNLFIVFTTENEIILRNN